MIDDRTEPAVDARDDDDAEVPAPINLTPTPASIQSSADTSKDDANR